MVVIVYIFLLHSFVFNGYSNSSFNFVTKQTTRSKIKQETKIIPTTKTVPKEQENEKAKLHLFEKDHKFVVQEMVSANVFDEL